MIKIKPFRGVRYNQDKVDLSLVMAPPYDVISPSEKQELLKRSEYNIVNLTLGTETPANNKRNNWYIKARSLFYEWLEKGILIQDQKPCIYVLEEEFVLNNKKKKRKGFIFLVKIEDFNRGSVIPHEKTFDKPKEDRTNLLRVCKANFSSIFTLFSGNKTVCDILLNIHLYGLFVTKFNFLNIEHKLFKIENVSIQNAIINSLKTTQLFIADGHHRYESALAYFQERRNTNPHHTGEESYNYVMVYSSDINDPALAILPTHRIIRKMSKTGIEDIEKKLSKYFTLVPVESKKEVLNNLNLSEIAVSIYKGTYILKRKKDVNWSRLIKDEKSKLDVIFLHDVIIEKILNINSEIDYFKDISYGLNEVRHNSQSIVFFLPNPRISDIKDIVIKGQRLPGKTTFFYPKLTTGVVINKLE